MGNKVSRIIIVKMHLHTPLLLVVLVCYGLQSIKSESQNVKYPTENKLSPESTPNSKALSTSMIDNVSKEDSSPTTTTLQALPANSNNSGDILNHVPLALAQKKSSPKPKGTTTKTTKKTTPAKTKTTKKSKATTKKPSSATKIKKKSKKTKNQVSKSTKKILKRIRKNQSPHFRGIGLFLTFLMSFICLII